MLRAGVKDNVLPAYAKAKVNFRILPGETVESTLAHTRSIINDSRVNVFLEEPEFASNPMPIASTETAGFRAIQRTTQEIFPEAIVAPSLVIALTDSRHYARVSDNIYRFSPMQLQRADLKSIHGSNEKISVATYENMIRFYQRLITNSCQ